jgi:undecaprenyl diphosphate synthase
VEPRGTLLIAREISPTSHGTLTRASRLQRAVRPILSHAGARPFDSPESFARSGQARDPFFWRCSVTRSSLDFPSKPSGPAEAGRHERLCSRTRHPDQSDPARCAEPMDGGRDRFHVAINMDGNGRWAVMRGLPREEGHVAGAAAVRRTVESAPALGITTLTLYAFSSDNWRRPRGEVDNLMLLLQHHLDSECAHLTDSGVRWSAIGRRDRIPGSLRRSIEQVEERTREGTSLHLRVAIDYSAREALVAAAGRLARGRPPTRQAFERSLCEAIHAPAGTRDVDLLIRTGGEQRLSDFLLWESAYAELYFTDVMWPDFTEADLASAVQSFAGRDRRYGGVNDHAHLAHRSHSTRDR